MKSGNAWRHGYPKNPERQMVSCSVLERQRGNIDSSHMKSSPWIARATVGHLEKE